MVVRDENYYQISGWMINTLHLKGIALKVYAIIYGFSQDGESEFTGSLQYLCDFTGGTSKPTIIKALKELTEKQYIIRSEVFINNVQFNRYKANLPLLKILNGGSKETLMGGSKETLPNNKSFNNNLNNEIKKERKKTTYDDILSQITDESLKDLCLEYIKMRKMIKAPMTDRALTMLIKKVNELEPTDISRQKRLLETAIINNWKSVYPLKDAQKQGNKNKSATYNTINYSLMDQIINADDTKAKEPPKTAGESEEVRAKAEALRKKIAEQY